MGNEYVDELKDRGDAFAYETSEDVDDDVKVREVLEN